MSNQIISTVGTYGGIQNITPNEAQDRANGVNSYLGLVNFHATMRIGGSVHGNANNLTNAYSKLKMDNVTGDELKNIARELATIHEDGVITDDEVTEMEAMVSDANAVWTFQNNNNDGDADSNVDFDFWQDMSINLPGGIRILADTRDSTNSDSITGSEASWTSRLIVSNGDETIEVTGLAGGIDGANNLDIRRVSDGSLGYLSTRAPTELWLSNDGTFYRNANHTNEVTTGEIARAGGFTRA